MRSARSYYVKVEDVFFYLWKVRFGQSNKLSPSGEWWNCVELRPYYVKGEICFWKDANWTIGPSGKCCQKYTQITLPKASKRILSNIMASMHFLQTPCWRELIGIFLIVYCWMIIWSVEYISIISISWWWYKIFHVFLKILLSDFLRFLVKNRYAYFINNTY